MRGVRIQNVVNELNNEKIDVIEWNEDPARYVANSLSRAQVVRVSPSDETKTATVMVPERQLSLAIGKEGQNARLAAKLTGWRIDIKSEAAVAPRVGDAATQNGETAANDAAHAETPVSEAREPRVLANAEAAALASAEAHVDG